MLKEPNKLYNITIQRCNVRKYKKMGFQCVVGDIISVSIQNLIELGSILKIDIICDICNKEFTRQARQIRVRDTGDKCCHGCVNRLLNLKDPSLSHLSVKERKDLSDIKKYDQVGLSKKDKIKHTNLKKFGVENPFQSNDIKEKIKQTHLIKYGTEHACQSEIVKNKIKHTNLKKFGVENAYQAEEVKENIKKTKLERYDNEYFNNVEKRIQTNLENYGVGHSFQREDIKEIIRITNKEYKKSPEFFEFRRQLRETNFWGEYRTDRTDWVNYKYLVWMHTKRNNLSSLDNYNKRSLAGTEGGYQLDHKISIKFGFDNNICPSVIGNINNIEFIPWKENIKKSNNCSILLIELLNQIKDY